MNTRDSVSALQPLEARLIRNMIAETGRLRIRKGKTSHQTVTGASSIGSMWTHEGVISDVLLAAANGKIFNVTGAPSELATGYSLNTWSTVQFNDTSTDSNGTVVAWAWYFGDGSAPATVKNPTHRFTIAGTYWVSLQVTDNNGATATLWQSITIAP